MEIIYKDLLWLFETEIELYRCTAFFKGKWIIYLFIYLSFYLFIYLFIYLFKINFFLKLYWFTYSYNDTNLIHVLHIFRLNKL